MEQNLYLNPLETIFLDIIIWVIIHLCLGYCSSKIPLNWLNTDNPFFQTFSWEKGGQIYQKLFHVRSWKRFIPNGSRLYRGAFSINNLPTNDTVYLERWLKESIRAEICHWMMIPPGFFFFLWNNVAVGWAMVAYAFLNNLIPIIMQRFNRPRIRMFLVKAKRDASQPTYQGTKHSTYDLAGAAHA